MSKAFDDWWSVEWGRQFTPTFCEYDRVDLKEAFQAGRAYQREIDAKIAETNTESEPFIEPKVIVAKAIREQKIDD